LVPWFSQFLAPLLDSKRTRRFPPTWRSNRSLFFLLTPTQYPKQQMVTMWFHPGSL
jgi:hypothetical protein